MISEIVLLPVSCVILAFRRHLDDEIVSVGRMLNVTFKLDVVDFE